LLRVLCERKASRISAKEALQAHLERQTTGASPRGWQSVFGQARREEVEPVDAVVAEEFEHVKMDEWR